MLASTVQFSTYNQTPVTRPHPTHAPHREHSGMRYRPALNRDQRPPPATHTRTWPAPSGPNSVPTTSHPIPTAFPARPRTGRTSGDHQAPAELVSVPPSSTTPETCGPSRLTDRPVLGAALDHQHEAGGQCSL